LTPQLGQRTTLNEPFSEVGYKQLIEGLVKHEFYDEAKQILYSSDVINSVENIGTFQDNRFHNILVIKHSASIGARFKLATETFKLMAVNNIDAALVAYYSGDNELWRVSLVTLTFEENKTGRVTKTFSNPRRYSYVLGSVAKTVTPYKFLISKGMTIDFGDLVSRFSVEVVNNEFYKGIAKLYDELVGTDEIKAEIKYPENSEASHQFAVRLIGRVVFCWFLREKHSTKGIPLINRSILSRESANQSNYYHSILAPLFFQVLNEPMNKRSLKFQSGDFGKIPYLNGGLFSAQEDDYYNFDEITEESIAGLVDIPDEWIHRLFDLLELYHFTVDENTSVDVDLSIDPEMLGRIFENLLARINPETGETVRKATGSFYTPREVVEYMVDHTISEYLSHETGIETDYLKALVSYNLEDDKEFQLNDSQKRKVVDALNLIKILDPACGSGAYPIGALQKIVFILQQVDPDAKMWFENQIANTVPEVRHLIEREFQHENFDYIRKLGVIRESIFGVDIQPIATEIARLRCFLTLIVDERVDDNEPNRGVYPLPNLDFKFVTANTLIKLGAISSDTSNQIGFFEDQSGITELKRLRDDYFNSHYSEKDSLKFKFSQAQNKMLQRIIHSNSKGLAETTQKLSAWDPFSNESTAWFDAEWMFGVNDGFDIVIGNPPYGVSIRDTSRKTVQNSLGKVPDYEIYYYFIELAKEMINPHGLMSYIIPNTLLFNVYAKKYRLDLLTNWTVQEVIDCTAFPLFSTATVRNIIITLERKKDPGYKIHYRNTLNASNFSEIISKDDDLIASSTLVENSTNWGLMFKLPEKTIDIITKLKSMPKTIQDIFPEISQGLIAYDKYTGQSQELIKSRAFHYKEKTKDSLKEWLWGEDVTPYQVKWNGKEYIDYGSGIANPREPKYFLGERVLVREITNPKIFAGFTDKESYHDPALIVILNNENGILPLLAILNSRLATFYHFNSSPKATKGAFPKILVQDIKDFPLPDWSSVNRLTPMVTQLLFNKEKPESNIDLIEREIDNLVYELYGLDGAEIKLIEESIQ